MKKARHGLGLAIVRQEKARRQLVIDAATWPFIGRERDALVAHVNAKVLAVRRKERLIAHALRRAPRDPKIARLLKRLKLA